MKLLILRFCVVALITLVLGATAARAARLDNLFQAQVEAAGRDGASRNAALQDAMRQVLVRLTGSSSQLREPGAASLLQDPGRFVQQFRFLQSDVAGPDGPATLQLWVQFDDVALARAIRDLGLPYWGRDRPDVLLWLAVDNRGRRFLVSENADNEAVGAVLDAARLRGLPVTLPLMDLQDQRAVGFTDVWGGFVSAIQAASQRYRPQVILIGRLDHSSAGGSWRGDWTLLGPGGDRNWTSHAANLDAALEQGIGDAAQSLALRYAVVAAQSGARALVVDGVRNLQDYARAYNYLASLTPVDQVQVVRVVDQQVEFNLTLNAGEQSLLQTIRLGRTLQTVDMPESWHFRLGP